MNVRGVDDGSGGVDRGGVVFGAEEAGDATDLGVDVLAVEGDFGDHVRRNIIGVVGGGVVEAAALAGSAEDEVIRSVGSGELGLALFKGDGDGGGCAEEGVAEFLLDAQAGLASPGEADVVVGVDGVGEDLGAVVGALAVFGDERPHLSASNGEAFGGLGAAPDLALAEGVGVGLVVVRGDAGGEEVGFEVALELERAGIALEEATETALTPGKVELGDVSLVRAGVGSGVEGGREVGVDGTLTPDGFEREEGDGGDGDALVVKGCGGLDFFVQVALGVGEGLGKAGVGDFEVGDVAGEGLNGGGVLLDKSLELLGLLLGRGCGGCRGSGVRGGGGEAGVLIGVLLLEGVDLGLLVEHLLAKLADLALGGGLAVDSGLLAVCGGAFAGG